MISEKAKELIPSDVKVKHWIDLSAFEYNNGALFDLLKELKEDQFEENLRIVFYHSNILSKDFDDLPPDILIKLQKILCQTDIPNYFCLVISDMELNNDLTYVCQHHAVNETPIKLIMIK